MKDDIKALEDTLGKIKRHEMTLSLKIDSLDKSQEAFSELAKSLTMEVEEIKNLKKTLPEAVDQSLRLSASEVIPQLLPDLVEGFKEQTLSLIESSIKDAQRIKTEVDQVISQAAKYVTSQKRENILRRIGLTIIFCFSSLLTAGAIFYIFPQTVNYGMTYSMAEAVVFGEAFMENSEKLTLEQRQFFISKAADKLKLQKHAQ